MCLFLNRYFYLHFLFVTFMVLKYLLVFWSLLTLAHSFNMSMCYSRSPRSILLDVYAATASDIFPGLEPASILDICDLPGIDCNTKTLNLSGIGLKGYLPEAFWCLDLFSTIDMSHNPGLTGNFGDICLLSNVRTLNLANTSLHGSLICSHLQNSIHHLNLSNTCIDGTLSQISRISGLTSLDISYSFIESPLYVDPSKLSYFNYTCTPAAKTEGVQFASSCSYYLNKRCTNPNPSRLLDSLISPYTDFAKTLSASLCVSHSNNFTFFSSDNVLVNCASLDGSVVDIAKISSTPSRNPSNYMCTQCSLAYCDNESPFCIDNIHDLNLCLKSRAKPVTIKNCPTFNKCKSCLLATSFFSLYYQPNSFNFISFSLESSDSALYDSCENFCSDEELDQYEQLLSSRSVYNQYPLCVNSETATKLTLREHIFDCIANGSYVIPVSNSYRAELQSSGFCQYSRASTCECATCWAHQLINQPYFYTFNSGCGDRTIKIDNCLTICPYYNYLPNGLTGIDRLDELCYDYQSDSDFYYFACTTSNGDFTEVIRNEPNSLSAFRLIESCLQSCNILVQSCSLSITKERQVVHPICDSCLKSGSMFCNNKETCHTLSDAVIECTGSVSCCETCPMVLESSLTSFHSECTDVVDLKDALLKLSEMYTTWPSELDWKEANRLSNFIGVTSSHSLYLKNLHLTLKDSYTPEQSGRLLACLLNYFDTLFIEDSEIVAKLPPFLPPNLKHIYLKNTSFHEEFDLEVIDAAGVQVMFFEGIEAISRSRDARISTIGNLAAYRPKPDDRVVLKRTRYSIDFTVFEKLVDLLNIFDIPYEVYNDHSNGIADIHPDHCSLHVSKYYNQALAQLEPTYEICVNFQLTSSITYYISDSGCGSLSFKPCCLVQLNSTDTYSDDNLNECAFCIHRKQLYCSAGSDTGIYSHCIDEDERLDCLLSGNFVHDSCTHSDSAESFITFCEFAYFLQKKYNESGVSTEYCFSESASEESINYSPPCAPGSYYVRIDSPDSFAKIAVCNNFDYIPPTIPIIDEVCDTCLELNLTDDEFICFFSLENDEWTISSKILTIDNVAECISKNGKVFSSCLDISPSCWAVMEDLDCEMCLILSIESTSPGFCQTPTNSFIPIRTHLDIESCFEVSGKFYSNCSQKFGPECQSNFVPTCSDQHWWIALHCLAYERIMGEDDFLCVALQEVEGFKLPVFSLSKSPQCFGQGQRIESCSMFQTCDLYDCIACVKALDADSDNIMCYTHGVLSVISLENYTAELMSCYDNGGFVLASQCESLYPCTYPLPYSLQETCAAQEFKGYVQASAYESDTYWIHWKYEETDNIQTDVSFGLSTIIYDCSSLKRIT